MPLTQDVSCDVTVNDVPSSAIPVIRQFEEEKEIPFTPTDVEVDLSASPASNTIVATGRMDNPSELAPDQEINVSVNGNTICIADLKKATQNVEGDITIEAYDLFYDVHNTRVTLQTEKPRFLNEIARDLLQDFSENRFGEDRVIGRFEDPNQAEPGSIYVAPGRDFPQGDNQTHVQYGSGQAGESLTSVLNDLADRLTGVVWTDKRNVLRLEPIPERQKDVLQYIVDGGAGENTTENDRVKEVIVQSQAVSTQQTAPERTAAYLILVGTMGIGRMVTDRRVTGDTRTLQDNNILTHKELNKRAASEMINIGLQEESGSVTVAGTPEITPWDKVQVPDNDRMVLAEGDYTAAGIKHVLNPTDGWTTEIDLRPDLEAISNSMSGESSLVNDITSLFTGSIATTVTVGLG